MNPTIRKHDGNIEFTKEINDLMTIGSDPNCQFLLFGEAVMERHCRIEKRNEGHILKDLRSPMGTFVNGARILEAILQDGDLIAIGPHQLVYSKQGQTPPRLKSRNTKLNLIFSQLPNLAASTHSVLLTGPSGVGKDVIAHEIHNLSDRKFGSFLSVNCSALTETLIESELFGHIKGSFTGAIRDRKGAFEACRGGTLFLDEIGDLPMSLQAKLLRALENNEIRPVGSDRIIKTDVRIIAATHQNLAEKIQNKEFREDLYYRLNVISVELPSLKARMEDFEEIFYSFCKTYRVRFSFNAIQILKSYSWPGNIRELKNTIARASVYFLGKEITPEMLPEIIKISTFNNPLNSETSRPKSIVKELEKQIILDSLIANRGNQKRTANQLGMAKSTLHDKLKGFNISAKSIIELHG